jgi:hypothetical protein
MKSQSLLKALAFFVSGNPTGSAFFTAAGRDTEDGVTLLSLRGLDPTFSNKRDEGTPSLLRNVLAASRVAEDGVTLLSLRGLDPTFSNKRDEGRHSHPH